VARFRGQRNAFGQPGISPRWTHGDKDGVGTAYAASSRVWFTLWNGILTEVYYPTVDRPQTGDLQLLVTDGKSFFHEERRHLHSRTPPCASSFSGPPKVAGRGGIT
jgi:glucoamylase